jgi:hypothetical protein
MKREHLLKHLRKNGVIFYSEGSRHTKYLNPVNMKITHIPRHKELDDTFCNEICKQLGIPKIKEGK